MEKLIEANAADYFFKKFDSGNNWSVGKKINQRKMQSRNTIGASTPRSTASSPPSDLVTSEVETCIITFEARTTGLEWLLAALTPS